MARKACKRGHSRKKYGYLTKSSNRKPYWKCRLCNKIHNEHREGLVGLSREDRAATQAKVPLEPIRRRVFSYLKEYGWDPNEKWEAWRFQAGDISPLYPLAESAGILHDTLDGVLKAKSREWIFFDMADKLLAAIDQVDAWYDDDLIGWYAVASAAADRRFPIKSAA